MRLRTFIALSLVCAPVLGAQQSRPAVEVRDLRAVPRDIADEVQQVFNATASRRASGDLTIPATETVNGDVAVVSGHVVVSGRVTGRVVVINGSLIVRGEGRVAGPITVIGGTVSTLGRGQVEGSARSYPEHVAVETTENLLVICGESDDERWYRRRTTPVERSRGDLRLVTAKTYN